MNESEFRRENYKTATQAARLGKNKRSFLLDLSSLETLETMNLDDESLGRVYRAVMGFVLHDIEPDPAQSAGMIAKFITAPIERANEEWLAKCAKNQQIIRDRWAKTREE